MKTFTTMATVTADGKVTLQLPPDITPGEHQVVLVIDEDIKTEKPTSPYNFNVPSSKWRKI